MVDSVCIKIVDFISHVSQDRSLPEGVETGAVEMLESACKEFCFSSMHQPD
jgi:hypothetical protein